MKEINKDNIEQLKRDLYSYGYYSRAIDDIKAKLYDVNQRLKDREKAQGISYGEIKGNSDPYHPSTASLIYEEETLRIELGEIEYKRRCLGFDNLYDILSGEEHEIIAAHFFDNLSYSYIQANMSYRNEEGVKYVSNKAIKKILKKTRT